MILKTIEIFDFKSVIHERIDLNSNQVCLVGVNESGKSSLIKAISFLNIEKELTTDLLNKSSENFPRGLPMIAGIFELNRNNDEVFFNFLRQNTSYNGYDLTSLSDTFYLQFKRWGNGFNNLSIELIIANEKIDILESLVDVKIKSEFLDKVFHEHFPVIELFENEDLLLEAATIDDLKGNDLKFETFRCLLHLGGCKNFDDLDTDNAGFFATYISRIEIRINAILKKHYKQDQSISLSIRSVGNKITVLIHDNTNQSFEIQERSPGFRYYFSFLINKLYYNVYYENRDVVFLLDEPGQNLHPKGAKDLLKTFSEISLKNLIIYTTHNPFLTARNNIDSLIYVSKKAMIGTKIDKKPWRNRYDILRKELGILLNDSFLIGDMNLLVEGITEKYVFHIIFNMPNYSHLEWLNIYNIDGIPKLSQTLNFLGENNLDQCGVILLDSDKAATTEKAKHTFKRSINSNKWDYVEINDVFDDKTVERTFEDLFPQDLYIKAFNKYCKSLVGLKIFTREYLNYEYDQPIPCPIIEHMSNHFYQFTTREKGTISKQDVMRNLLSIIYEDAQKVETNLQYIFKLANLIHSKMIKIEEHVNKI